MNAFRRLCRTVRQRLSGEESGFTLAELLVVISISSTIVLVIGMAFVTASRTSMAANTRLRESKDAQILNAYFIADGAGVSSVSLTAPSVSTCAAGLSGTTPVAEFGWTDLAGVTKVAYYYKTGSAPSTLKRRLCSGGVPGGSDVTIGRHIASTSVACDPACSGIPTSVALTVTETSGYTYTVELSPRSAAPTGTYDGAPSVRAIRATNANPSKASQVQYSVTFSEAVTGVDSGDLLLTSTPAGATLASLIGVGGGSTYTAVVNTGTLGNTADGTIRLDVVQNNTIKDRSAKALTGAATGETYTVDKVAPTVTLAQKSGQSDPTGDAPVFTATFSEAVSGFDASDVTLTGATGLTVAGVAATDSTNRTFDITVGGLGTGATATVAVPAGKVTDKAGNLNTASTGSDTTVTYDGVAPKVVSINRKDTSPTSATSVSWTVTFGESVGGVDTGDFALVKGTGFGGGPAITGVAGNGATRTVTASTGTGGATLGLNLVDNDSITDTAGNSLAGVSGAVGDFTGQLYTVNTVNPVDYVAPTITGVQLLNKTGGTAGEMEEDDQIVLSFSERLKAPSICSTWANDAADHSLSGSNDVTVTVTKGYSLLWWSVPDTISVSAGSCTLNVGTIDLGVTGYLNSSVSYGSKVTFAGTSSSASVIAWDATNKKLTITLGRPSNSSPLGTVSSSTATYEADSGLTDPAGNGVSPSTKATGNVRQF